MDTFIQLHKYFYEPTSYDMDKVEVGNDKESFNGTYYMQITGEYYAFDMEFENLSAKRIGQLEYINNICKPDSGLSTKVDYIDLYGDHYQVIIPLNGFKYTPSKGNNKLYNANLKLRGTKV